MERFEKVCKPSHVYEWSLHLPLRPHLEVMGKGQG